MLCAVQKSFRLTLSSAGWLILIVMFAGPVEAGTDVRPNVVVMLVDDMGIMDTSVPFLTDANGQPKRYPLNDFYRTPNMARLAERGIRFSQFNAMSVCSPTRIALMTGQNAARHRTTNWINPDTSNGGPQGPPKWNWSGLKPGDITLPGLLRAQGYRTIHAGKGHFSPRQFPGADPSTLGFEVNIGGASIGAPASYYGEQNYGNTSEGSSRKSSAVPGLAKYHGTSTFLTDALTQEALKQVSDAVSQQQPFFLYFAQYAVHSPFNSDPRFAPHYRDSGKPAAAQAFATLIEGMDKSLGDVLDHLERLGVAENTVVFFLGDNGSDAPLGHEHAVACAAPLRGKKGSHYEGGVRVPFLAAWGQPNPENSLQQRLPIAAGRTQSQLACAPDLFPTILELTGVPVPTEHVVDGQRLQGLLAGDPDPERHSRFLMHYPHSPHRSDYWTSYRDGDWKVIYHYFPGQDFSKSSKKAPADSPASGKSRYELYDLKADPFEQNDVSGSQRQELQRLMGGLIASLKSHAALYPVDEQGRDVVPLPAAITDRD